MYANLLSIAVPLPLPMTAILIIVTDLGFELFLALSFAWDVSENKTGLMKLPPRKPVTEESKARLKRIQELGDQNVVSSWITSIRDPEDVETLVDSEVLMWAYIEAGTIQAMGCLVCYFYAMYQLYKVTPTDAYNFGGNWGQGDIVLGNGDTLSEDDQLKAVAAGQSAFYIALFVQQSFNLFCCKARLGLPIGNFMFANPKNFYGVLAGGIFSFALVYIPPLNIAFGTNWQTPPLVIIIAFGFGVLLYGYSFCRFLVRRLYNPIQFTKDIQGLDLHPTRFSTGR